MTPTAISAADEWALLADGISEEDLTALALAADPDQLPAADARPDPAFARMSTLPLSYMPPAMAGEHVHRRGTAAVALVLVSIFLVITALGFCITYGQLAIT